MKKRGKVLIIGVIVAAGCISLIYAAQFYELSFTNKFQTGIVDVDIEQYRMTESGEVPAVPGEVHPNQDVSYIPRVTNLSADAFVRVKVDIVMDLDIPLPITLENVYGINPEWVQRGEYFYLTKVLGTGEVSDLFTGFHVPAEWENETAGSFRIKVSVDAVQAQNFEPDFGALLPWGTIDVQQAKLEENISYSTVSEKSVEHVFTYTSYNGLESETEDLFTNFDLFIAGDSFEDVLKMKNSSDSEVKLYFKTETTDSSLVNQMRLSITCDGEPVYSGSLASDDINDWIELTTVEKGKAEDFKFRVWLPEESDNFYTVLKDEVVWKFKCTEMDDPVQTGDESGIPVLYAVVTLAAFVLMFTVLTGRRGGRK